MSQITKRGTGGSPVNGIQTINGDTGSITGNSVTIFANIATNNSGGTVSFDNSGTVSTLNLSDLNGSTFLGNGAGNTTAIGTFNTAVGTNCMPNVDAGFSNIAIGNGSLGTLTDGVGNVCVGNNSGDGITTGSGNICVGAGTMTSTTTSSNCCAVGIASLSQCTANNNTGIGTSALQSVSSGSANTSLGASAGSTFTTGTKNLLLGFGAGALYTGAESNNIILDSNAVAGESDTTRIGTTQTRFFAAGIANVTVSNTEIVTINTATGQLGSQASTAPAGVVVSAYLATTLSNVTGDNTSFNPIFDSTNVNDGTSYDTATGIFTAPSAGNYFFTIQLSYTGIVALTNVGSMIVARKNGNQFQTNALNVGAMYDPIQTIGTVTMAGIINLASSDTLDFRASVGGGALVVNLFGADDYSNLGITKLA